MLELSPESPILHRTEYAPSAEGRRSIGAADECIEQQRKKKSKAATMCES